MNLTVHAGEVLGIAGLMGAGPHGTARMPVTVPAASSPEGSILIDGQPVSFRHPAEALAAGVALVTEDRKRLGLFADLNIGQNITLCQLRDAVRSAA